MWRPNFFLLPFRFLVFLYIIESKKKKTTHRKLLNNYGEVEKHRFSYFNMDCFQPFSIARVANMCNDRGDVRDFSLLDNIFWLEILFPSF